MSDHINALTADGETVHATCYEVSDQQLKREAKMRAMIDRYCHQHAQLCVQDHSRIVPTTIHELHEALESELLTVLTNMERYNGQSGGFRALSQMANGLAQAMVLVEMLPGLRRTVSR